jgi:hypothetical protein
MSATITPRDCWLSGVADAANTLDAAAWGERCGLVPDAELAKVIASLVLYDAPIESLADADSLDADALGERLADWARGYAHVAVEAVLRLRAGGSR